MIVLSKKYIENNKDISRVLRSEEQDIISKISLQKNLYNQLLKNMSKLVKAAENPNLQPVDKYLEVLNGFKTSLVLFDTNIQLLNDLLHSIITILFEIDANTISNKSIKNFNRSLLAVKETVVINTIEIRNALSSAIPYYNFILDSKEYSEAAQKSIAPQKVKINENVLFISEIKGKVYLPYTKEDLEKILKANTEKYTHYDEIIENEYSLPLELFSNPIIARFREAFKLMRIKEHKSVKEAFELATELMLNYNLHPAIIRACKNIDQLDIYLDYLESNEIHLFDCFKIQYEVPPRIVKEK